MFEQTAGYVPPDPPTAKVVYCSWCGAAPDANCTAWDKPIDTLHPEREAAFKTLYIVLVAPELRKAGIWLGNRRGYLNGRRLANALLLGEMVHARADNLEWLAERAIRKAHQEVVSRG